MNKIVLNLFQKSKAYLTSSFILLLFVTSYPLVEIYLKSWLVIVLFVLALLFVHSPLFIWILFCLVCSFLNIKSLEDSSLLTGGIVACFFFIRFCFSFMLFHLTKKLNFLPKISQTERTVLLSGEPWIEKDFFTGCINFKNLFNQEFPLLKQEEKEFLNTKTEELCELSNEWDLIKRKKLNPLTEDFLKKQGFFGLTIPEKYKGKNFSPFAQAKLIEKLAGYNIPLSIIVMVPNSLGPAKLILKYGTQEQKNKYLSRLAQGEEWPCFGLTEPQAGSDASSIQSEGVLFKEGEILKIRLNWSKRWITLSSKTTLIGLAVQLKDPEKLYSNKTDLGITCVLVPGKAKGVEKKYHHDPMGIPIYNAPIKGVNVVVNAEEAIIGGLNHAGQGWKMLMESLSSGRGISLPSLSIGCGKKISWLTGTYSFVRKQFNLPIGKFEGVEEALSQIAGLTHLITSTQTLTLAGLNQGIHPPVITALTKYQVTEITQKIIKKGMDIMAGVGLSLGPKNKIATPYTALPLAITVEGANILTRTFIVYGQGLIKTHPHAYPIIQSLEQNNFKKFHQNFWSFCYQGFCNSIRGLILTGTRGWLFIYPFSPFKTHRYLQKMIWSAGLFSFLSNLNLLIFGGRLKTKGKLTGRFADWLSFQYMALSLIWFWKKQGQSEQTWIKTKWGLEYCFGKIQESLLGILSNYPNNLFRLALKPLFLLLKINPIGQAPSDSLGKKLAQQLLKDENFKQSLCENMYFPKDEQDQFQKLQKAYKLCLKESKILQKIKSAGHKISIKSALDQNIISLQEFKTLQSAKQARWEAIQVDTFTDEEYFGHK